MFPECPRGGTTRLPPNAQFWTPRSTEIDPEDGIGFFRDTWLIRNISRYEAREIISAERQIAAVVGELAVDSEAFERLASVAESAAVDDPAEPLDELERLALGRVVSDVPELGGLELGVAGLAHAMATVRIVPAASCRSHPGRSWSDAPVVLFAASEYRAKALEPLVEQSGCTFDIDKTRPELLVVRGRSIADTMALSEAIMSSAKTFVQTRTNRQHRHRKTVTSQESLF